jgi:transposase InsO family protein
MPWTETCAVSERERFIRDWLKHPHITELSVVYGISRVTAYKWIERYLDAGRGGLTDRSRRPHHCPTATAPEVVELVLALRRRWGWGPKKLATLIRERHPEVAVPALSTIGDILRRSGLVVPIGRRRHQHPAPPPVRRGSEPNDVWCVDYKGEFRLGNGRYCYPLTLSDEYSRFLLAARAHERISGLLAQAEFTRVFREHGLPRTIRSDNGSPFAGRGVARLSRLSVWWMKLGIGLVRNRPGHPEHNGCHERMHRDLKAETTRPPQADGRAQQRVFDQFQRQRNEERPHEALGQKTPSRLYRRSTCQFPEKLPLIEYPGHYEVRRVSPSGCIKFSQDEFFVSSALAREDVGLAEEDDGRWAIYFSTTRLGTWNPRAHRLEGIGQHDSSS